MKIAENIYKIQGNGNIYLITKPTPTIIDTSNQVDSLHIKSAIEKIISLNKIKIVLLTHLHFDHAGNLELFPNASFYASSEEIKNYNDSPKDFLFHNISDKNDKILREKLIPLSERIAGLKVIKCPGHTRGSVAFLDEKNKFLFSGDTIFENGVGRTDFPNSVPKKMEETLKRLTEKIKDKNLKILSGHDY